MWQEFSYNRYDFSNMSIGERLHQEEYDEIIDDEFNDLYGFGLEGEE